MLSCQVLFCALFAFTPSTRMAVAMNTALSMRKQQQHVIVNADFDPSSSDPGISGSRTSALQSTPVPGPGLQRRVAGIYAVAWGNICAQKPSLCKRPEPNYHRRPRPWYKPDSEKSYWS